MCRQSAAPKSNLTPHSIFFQVARNGVPCTKDIAVFCYDAVEGSGDQSLNVRVVQLSLDSWGQPSTDLAPAYKFDGTFADVLGVDTPINLRQAVLSSMKCQKAIEDSNGRCVASKAVSAEHLCSFYTPWNSLVRAPTATVHVADRQRWTGISKRRRTTRATST